MLGANGLRGSARRRALVGGIAVAKADGERLDRALGQPGHHRQHRRRIDAARQKHAERHIRTLVQAHAVGKGSIEPAQRLIFAGRNRAEIGQGRAAAALDDAPAPNHHRLARQYPVDPGKDRLAAGGELHL